LSLLLLIIVIVCRLRSCEIPYYRLRNRAALYKLPHNDLKEGGKIESKALVDKVKNLFKF
ncbi:MAG TPA: hypothetical protein VE134_09690, partial [Methanomicrobiales archaeon]|nr:hypothetical protein [Methanomicrobiales archaeon]